LAAALSLTNEAQAIRALRSQSNLGLSARDAEKVTAAFAEDIHSISGGGELVDGRAAVTKIYQDQLRPESGFISALRTPGRIAVNRSGDRAAEPGRWRWTVQTPLGEASFSGDYLAGWVRHGGRWRLQSELYVTTGCTGPGCSL